MTHHTGSDEGLAVALDEAMHKRLADWRASTSEAYFPLDSTDGPRVLVNYLLFGPGSITEVLAARAAAPDALRERVEALLADSCHHCGRMSESDGDHTCPCPNSHSECLLHTTDPVVGLLPLRAALADPTDGATT